MCLVSHAERQSALMQHALGSVLSHNERAVCSLLSIFTKTMINDILTKRTKMPISRLCFCTTPILMINPQSMDVVSHGD